jgi:hypothetical protein
VDGGSFVQPDILINATNIFEEGASTAILYVEGIGTSPQWGMDKIKVTASPISTPERPAPEEIEYPDEVSYTVVRCVYKICVYRPYVCLRNWGNVTNRVAFRTRYVVPRLMVEDYFNGLIGFDDHGILHETAASMGHAFTRVEIRQPDLSINYWTGQTGANGAIETQAAYYAMRDGKIFWFRASDGSEDPQVTSQDRYTSLYARFPLPPNSNTEFWMLDGVTKKKFVAVHEFRIRPETIQTINNYRAVEHPFGGYGLDTTLNNPSGDSCVGCGSYIGILTERGGLASASTVAGWGIDRDMPVVPLFNLTYTWIGSGANYLAYLTGSGRGLRRELRLLRDQADVNLNAAHELGSWTDGSGTRQSLKFCDPYLMADWVDALNNTTHWQQDGLQYKDRGVTIRYDTPQPSGLETWRNRRPIP